MKELTYPIRAVSKLTGISIDTLRAWEKRYNAVIPLREGRERVYKETDVQRLYLLKNAIDNGYSIGRVANLTNQEIEELINTSKKQEDSIVETNPLEPLNRKTNFEPLLTTIKQFDYVAAERELNRLTAMISVREIVHQVIVPLMQRVGEDWHKGKLSIAQEHMISALLRNFLGILIRIYIRDNSKISVLFATLSGERHEFGLLLAAILTAYSGLKVIYLGSDLPVDEVIQVAKETQIQTLVLGLTNANNLELTVKELNYISHELPSKIEIWVGGAKTKELTREIKKTRALFFDDLYVFEQHLLRLGGQL